MVRVKNRYLLVKILYPDATDPPLPSPSSAPSASASSSSSSRILPPKPLLPDPLSFQRPTPDAVTAPVVVRALRDEVGVLFGEWGGGLVGGMGGVSVKYLSPLTSTLIIRCPRAHYRMVWAALSSLSSLPIPNTSVTPSTDPPNLRRAKPSRSSATKALHCVFRVVHVSGTIRKAEEQAIRRARQEIRAARRLEGDGGVTGGLGEWFAGGGRGNEGAGNGVQGKWDGKSVDGSSEDESVEDG